MRNELRKLDYKIGRRHVCTMLLIRGLNAFYCRTGTSIVNPAEYKNPYLLRNLKIVRPNQVWGIDITNVPLNKGVMFLVVVIDLYSRYIVGRSLSNTMEAKWVADTVCEAVNRYGYPEKTNNIFIERFWRTIKYDKLYLECLETGQDAYIACRDFIEYYNQRRDYSSLDYKTPIAVYQSDA